METPGHDDLSDRLRRVEESQGFAERTIEQLSAEIAGLNRRLAEAQSRMQRLEAQLKRLLTPPDQADGESESRA